MSAEAAKLPDPLLVRYFRAGLLAAVRRVRVAARTRDVTVTFATHSDHWLHLPDIGWVPTA